MSDWWSRLRRTWNEGSLADAKVQLADAEHRLRLWGNHPGTPPSERSRLKGHVEYHRSRVEKYSRRVPS